MTLPTTLEYTTVHVTIQDLIENAAADTKGKVIYTPLVTTVPGIDGKIHQVDAVKDYLVDGSSSVNLLTGITWRAEFALQGPIPAPDAVEFTTDGTTINLAYEVTAENELVESRTVVVAGVATTAALTAGLAGKQDAATLEADTAAKIGTGGTLDDRLDARFGRRYGARLRDRFMRTPMQWPRSMARWPVIKSQNAATENLTTPKTWEVSADNTGAARWWGPVAATDAASGVASSPGLGVTGQAIAFEWHSDAPTLFVKGSFGANGPGTLYIDGEKYRRLPHQLAGNPYLQITHNFASEPRKMRHFKIVASNGIAVDAIVTDIKDTVFAPTFKDAPLVGWMGDSYSQGLPSAGNEFMALPFLVADLLGWRMHISTDGGTGFATVGTAGTYTFEDRIADLASHDLDALVFLGGINDSIGVLQQGVVDTLAAARAAFPDIPFYVIGPQSPSTTYETTNAAKWTAMETACATDPNTIWIDTRGWVTGTGTEAAPVGDGNADIVIKSDGTHLSELNGKPYYAMKMADEIVKEF